MRARKMHLSCGALRWFGLTTAVLAAALFLLPSRAPAQGNPAPWGTIIISQRDRNVPPVPFSSLETGMTFDEVIAKIGLPSRMDGDDDTLRATYFYIRSRDKTLEPEDSYGSTGSGTSGTGLPVIIIGGRFVYGWTEGRIERAVLSFDKKWKLRNIETRTRSVRGKTVRLDVGIAGAVLEPLWIEALVQE